MIIIENKAVSFCSTVRKNHFTRLLSSAVVSAPGSWSLYNPVILMRPPGVSEELEGQKKLPCGKNRVRGGSIIIIAKKEGAVYRLVTGAVMRLAA